MARIGSTLLLALVLTAPAYAEDVVLDRTRLSTILGDALEELARAEGQAEATGRGCRDVAGKIDRVRRQLKLLQDEVRSAEALGATTGSVTVTASETGLSMQAGTTGVVTTVSHGEAMPVPAAPVAEAAPTIYPMAHGDFAQLLSQLRNEAFADGKLRVVAGAADYTWFTAEQAGQILGTFDFGSDKVKALEIIAPRLYDYENGYRIFEAFEFDSDKNKARRILQRARH